MKRLLGLLSLLTLFLTFSLLFAAADSVDFSWWTVDGGGAPALSGGAYDLQGTAGQADAGTLGNGRYTLQGGYWNTTNSNPTRLVYLPLALRPD
jgi:hypothetical protein